MRKSAMKKHRPKVEAHTSEEHRHEPTIEQVRKVLKKQLSIKRSKRITEQHHVPHINKRSKSAGYFDDKLKIQKKKLLNQLSKIKRH